MSAQRFLLAVVLFLALLVATPVYWLVYWVTECWALACDTVTSDHEPFSVRRVALDFHKDAFSLFAPPVDLNWLEPKAPFLLRRVPSALVYALIFVIYGFLIALLTMAV